MREKIFITTIALLFLAGCGQPAPDLDTYNPNPSGVDYNGTDDTNKAETVDIDETVYGNGTGNGQGHGNGHGGNNPNPNYDTSNKNYHGNNSSGGNFRSIYFDFARYAIVSKMENNMHHNNQVAKRASGTMKIEGNCDEFGTDEYNYALGLKRAKAVKDRISAQGVDTSKMVLISLGESNPTCRETTDSCYDKNRRVDIHLAR